MTARTKGSSPVCDAFSAVAPEEPTVIAYMGAGDVTRLAHEAAGELSGDAVEP